MVTPHSLSPLWPWPLPGMGPSGHGGVPRSPSLTQVLLPRRPWPPPSMVSGLYRAACSSAPRASLQTSPTLTQAHTRVVKRRRKTPTSSSAPPPSSALHGDDGGDDVDDDDEAALLSLSATLIDDALEAAAAALTAHQAEAADAIAAGRGGVSEPIARGSNTGKYLPRTNLRPAPQPYPLCCLFPPVLLGPGHQDQLPLL